MFLINEERDDEKDINHMSQREKNKHIFFLENLLLKLKNDQLSFNEKRQLSEFYIKSMFERNQSNQSNESNEEKKNSDNFYKYLSMGWYIYEFLINDNIDDINKDGR